MARKLNIPSHTQEHFARLTLVGTVCVGRTPLCLCKAQSVSSYFLH